MENIYRLIRNAILRFFAQTTLRNDAELDFYGIFYIYIAWPTKVCTLYSSQPLLQQL